MRRGRGIEVRSAGMCPQFVVSGLQGMSGTKPRKFANANPILNVTLLQCLVLIRRFPVLPKEQERDVVRHQQRRTTTGGNPGRWAHVRVRPVDCGQNDGIEQVQGSFDIEDPH